MDFLIFAHQQLLIATMQEFKDFKGEYSLMLADSKVFHKLFVDNMADFTPFDPDLDAAFATAWKDAYQLAEDIPSDETFTDVLQQHTADIATQEKICIDAAIETKYKVNKAFRGDSIKPKEFGFHTMHSSRQSTPKFIVWMKVLHNRAVKYKSELIAAGMPEADIDALLAKANNLENAEVQQEVHKRERLATTQKRIKAYNDLWKFATAASYAASIVYSDNKEMRELFRVG